MYLQFSPGPAHDRDRTTRDDESGLELPGLSVVALPRRRGGTVPGRTWVARQICTYVQPAVKADDDRHGWLLRGQVVARGPDSEPLVEAPVALARLERLLVVAEAHYRDRVRNDPT